jgi:hypothetical protein
VRADCPIDLLLVTISELHGAADYTCSQRQPTPARCASL